MSSVALLGMLAAVAHGQVAVQLTDAGPGPGPEILTRALAAPHTLVPPQAGRYVIRADSVVGRTLISIGNTVVVEGTVHGDLIVVGGDLYMHPGGSVDGRAIALGGGVYESMLAHTGGVAAYRDFTYDVSPIAGGYALSYHALEDVEAVPTFSLPGIKGIQIPAYDRTNGLSLPIGAIIAVPHSGVRVVPTITYRSQLGRLDPDLGVEAPLDRRTTVRLDAGRGTFTNESWIRSDLLNSLAYGFVGSDARNYYRASRAQGTLGRLWETAASSIEPYVGAQVERANSVRPDSNATGGPWTLFNRHDPGNVLRANPRINPGTLTSLLLGARWKWETEGIFAGATLGEEVGRFSPKTGFTSNAGSFAQTTVEGAMSFPTFGLQRLSFHAHGVFTGGDEPRQRWAYLGGSGTIPTLALLERGGNQLFYLDAGYAIPLAHVQLPMIGPPVVTLREILAGAAENRFPSLSQATGVRVSAGFVYAELLFDPVSHRTYSGFGVSLDR